MRRLLPTVALAAVFLLLGAGCRATPTAATAPRSAYGSAEVSSNPWVTPPATSIARPVPQATQPQATQRRAPQPMAQPLAQPVPQRVAVRNAVAPRWSVEAEVGVFSRYVWRGALATDDPVLQPAIAARYGGFSAHVWGNVDLGDANGMSGELNEINLIAQYEHQVVRVPVPATVFGGVIWYTSPNDWFDDFAEVYAGVGWQTFLNPKLTAYIGVHEVEGHYITLDGGHDCRLGCGMLQLRGGIGFGTRHFFGALFGVTEDTFGELYLEAGWAATFGRWTLTPSVRFSTLLDSALRDAQAENDLVIFGLKAAVRF